MVQIQLSKEDYTKIKTLIFDIFPHISFSLKAEDTTLMHLDFCNSAPCIVEFDISWEEFDEMLEILNDIEVDAFNTPSGTQPHECAPEYKKYLKYGCLYDILYNAEIIKAE